MKTLFMLLGVALLGPLAHAAPVHHASAAPAPTLEFIENKGQWAAPVRYAAAVPGGRLFAEADGLRFALFSDVDLPGHRAHPAPEAPVRAHALDLRFAGAAPARITPEGPTAERRNYFLGADAAHWARGVRSYRQLHYAGLWPGVDARFYENAQQQLEYDFEVAAGANAAAIGLRHAGADAVRLAPDGRLQVQTSAGTLEELAPQAWQTDAQGQRQPVACRYALSGDVVHFALGPYDHTRALTIDPVVVFATYTGSLANNWGFTATYDAQGNLYSGGIAFGPGYPATVGAYKTTFGGVIDMALIKYNVAANGASARVWATYLGGTRADYPHSLVVNGRGELLVLGTTASADFPTTAGALQRTFGGGTVADPFGDGTAYEIPGSDLVISRFSADGAALAGSTYLGGSGNDGLLPLQPFSSVVQLAHNYGDSFRGDIGVDAAGNVYVASCTSSSNFPVARGFQSTYRGGTSDGVVCKLNAGLTSLLWGSYLGGSASDAAYSLQVAPGSGEVYVAGGTLSPDLPATAGALHPGALGGVDGFAARISADGTTLRRTTYLGTSAYDQAYFLQLGSDGGVYTLGQTLGAYPTTAGLYQNANGRQFIHKLSADLAQTQLATVFGSGRASVDIAPTAFLVDRCDRVFVCGWGGTSNLAGAAYLSANAGGSTYNLPVTADAAQRTTNGSNFYLAQFAAGLTALGYGTYFGNTSTASIGEHVDGGTSRFDPRGVVYQAVCSCFTTTGFPIPPGVNTYSPTNGSAGTCNNAAFVLNFQPDIAQAGADQERCLTAGPLALVGSPGGGTWAGDGVSGSAAAGFVFNPTAAGAGPHVLTYTVASTGDCTTSSARRITVTAPPTATFAALPQAAYCLPAITYGAGAPTAPTGPAPVPLAGTPAGGVFSGPGVSGSVATGFVFDPKATGNGTFTLTYTYDTGCPSIATQQVSVLRITEVGPQTQFCANAAPTALVASPAGGTWSGPGVGGSVAGYSFDPAKASPGANALTYTVGAPGGSCAATLTRVITVNPVPAIAFAPVPVLCTNNPAPQLLAATPAGGYWAGFGVFYSGSAYYFTPTTAGTFQLRYSVSTGQCAVDAMLAITVANPVAAQVPADTLLCPGSTRPFALRGAPAGGTWSGPGVSGNAATGYVFTPPAGFSGSVALTYAAGSCSTSAVRRVGVAPVPAVVAGWAPAACPEDRQVPLRVQFNLGAATNGAAVSGTVWDFGDGTQSTDASPAHTYAAAGRYQPTLRLRYNNGRCETTAALAPVEATDAPLPNIITPNGDGLNQTFRLPASCAPRIQIFSRWGQPVFEAVAYQNDWAAEGQPAGTYYYLLHYPDGHRVKGWLQVVK
ncbi:DUF7948 domain-containing protein [Hymenobacter sp. PAMC 26628]|uniref:DUF7948 domain-containing protein n=1 Tax=Hymenobacter sp. PAMC 26628 TaxID=1484118 RepID=UPI0012FFA5BC|nr:gliding motility-associated C-terminal domain-containing protein [Hymenobacter sp. PAMC 26628]